MSSGDDIPPPAAAQPASPIRDLLRRDGWLLVAATVTTLAVGLGFYAAARSVDVSARRAMIASLAATTLWVALACGVLAAGGSGALSALARGGIVADAACGVLLVLWLVGLAGSDGPPLTFAAAVKIYCTFVAMALAGIAAARCARREAGRYAAAVIAAAVMTTLLASPFWISGPAGAAEPSVQRPLVSACVHLNPFYSVTSAIVQQTGFIWHQSGALYERSRLFDYAPPAVPWYAATVVYGLVACILAATHLVRRPAGPPRQ